MCLKIKTKTDKNKNVFKNKIVLLHNSYYSIPVFDQSLFHHPANSDSSFTSFCFFTLPLMIAIAEQKF